MRIMLGSRNFRPRRNATKKNWVEALLPPPSQSRNAGETLPHGYIVVEGVGRVARVVVIMANQGEGVGMACCDAGRHLYPNPIVVTRLRQDG